MRTLFGTLRSRLTLWYAVTLAVVLGGFGTLLYGVVRYQLLAHHDAELREVALAVAGILKREPDCERLTSDQVGDLDRVGHVVLFHETAGEGRVFYRSPDSSGLPVPTARYAEGALEHGRFQTLGPERALVRVFSEPYRAHSGRRGVIHVVERLGDVVAPLASLRLALLLMAPVAILISAAGGYWLAGRALTPVDQVTRLAREIEASSLGRRLPRPRVHDEIGRLVDTLNQMISRLETSFEGMKRFTADASHELRGPLARMRGAIDVVLARPREAAEYRNALGSVGEDVDHLRALVEDLLVLARADAGRVEFERTPLRLDVVAAEVAEAFLPAANEKTLRLMADCRVPLTVLGDERWLRQLVVNLVENAVKFSAPGGSVSVAATAESGRATLSVADSGPGIPEDALGRIFERFYRVDHARSFGPAPGFGLGLAIASWVAEAHGGRITAENLPGGGSRFAVSLPVVS
jgi:heavy metal sensor kinase